MAFELAPLPYAYDALEPTIDAQTMTIHHDKHHATYITNLNAAVEKHPELASWSVEQLVTKLNDVPEDIRTAVRNHGGGHYNHSMFWEIMAPKAGGEPKGALLEAINKQWGTFAKFKEEFTKTAVGTFGSGWAWLVKKADGSLGLVSTSNAATPLTTADKPLLTCDVWEHAYYIDYRNARPKYVESFWGLVNWDFVAKNFA